MIKAWWLSSLISVLLLPSVMFAQSLRHIALSQDVVWAFCFLPGGDILFTERQGKLKIYHVQTRKTTDIRGVPSVYSKGQGGLLDVILDKDFTKNSRLYFTYSKTQAKKATTAVYTALLKGDRLEQGRDLFVATTDSDASIHFGSRIRQSKEGHLFVSVGDRGERDLAQKLDQHHGKILRIDQNGKAVVGNPFVGQKGALAEIYSYGHRNPQGMDYDPERDELWVNEHGPRGGDEINQIKPGANYGWPLITHGKEYWGPSIGEGTMKEGIEPSIYQYTPSIAPSGLIRYRATRFKDWKDNFFSGALKLTHLNRLYYNKEKKSYVEDRLPLVSQLEKRIRSVLHGPQGEIVFSTDSGDLYFLE